MTAYTNTTLARTGRPGRCNNLNLVRLIFATLVIISHSAELVDGNQSREPLVRIFGTLSLGDVAVDGFFLISGYLISMSFVKSSNVEQYAVRRIARILPGYLVSFCICFFILAPVVGAKESPFSISGLKHFVFQISVLGGPGLPGVFQGTPYPGLNGSMWTIAYEARCYIVTALLGSVFAASRSSLLGLIAWVVILFTLAVGGTLNAIKLPHVIELTLGRLQSTAQLGAMFGTGAIFYLLRHRIRNNIKWASFSLVALLICMSSKWTAEPAFAIFGGYLIFFCGLHLPTLGITRWTINTDISYGTYLYAWPIQMTFIYILRDISPGLLTLFTVPLAYLFGLVSWMIIESPALDLAHHWEKRGHHAFSKAPSTRQ